MSCVVCGADVTGQYVTGQPRFCSERCHHRADLVLRGLAADQRRVHRQVNDERRRERIVEQLRSRAAEISAALNVLSRRESIESAASKDA